MFVACPRLGIYLLLLTLCVLKCIGSNHYRLSCGNGLLADKSYTYFSYQAIYEGLDIHADYTLVSCARTLAFFDHSHDTMPHLIFANTRG